MDKQTKELEVLTRDLASSAEQYNVLRSRHDCIVIRTKPANEQTYIVKLWKKPGIRGALRRVTQTGNIDREWKTLNHLDRIGLTVPKAIARFHFASPIDGYTDAIVMQDLGIGTVGTEYLTELLAKKSNSERIHFENNVIELTASILKAGVLDLDHHLVNILVTPSWGIVRLDFEISAIVRYPGLHRKKLSRMIAALMTSYIVASNADGKSTANEFAMNLANRLDLPADLLRNARVLVEQNLAQQQMKSGLDLHWTPPW